MVNKKTELVQNDFDTPFSEDLLAKLPLGYRFMVSKETVTIGELYQRVKFSVSKPHQSNQYITFGGDKPISNLLLESRNLEPFENE